MPACPLCARISTTPHARASDIEYHTLDRWFDFHRCIQCDILFIDPIARLDEIYPPHYYSFAPAGRSLARAVKEWLDRRHLGRNLRRVPGRDLAALDIGGGTGWLLDLLRMADPRVARTCVVDIDAGARARAEQAGHRYFQGRIEQFPATERFDVILMLNLIEHVPDPRAVLRKARDLLTREGRLFVKTPNFDALDARLFRHRSWGGYHTPRHFVLFRRESLERLCRECGLEVVEFSYTQGAPFWSVSMLDLLSRLGLASISADRPAIRHPLMPVLQAAFAGFDFARKPFARLSQMQLVLGRAT